VDVPISKLAFFNSPSLSSSSSSPPQLLAVHKDGSISILSEKLEEMMTFRLSMPLEVKWSEVIHRLDSILIVMMTFAGNLKVMKIGRSNAELTQVLSGHLDSDIVDMAVDSNGDNLFVAGMFIIFSFIFIFSL